MFFVLLLAISLSIDALGIGLCYGIRGIRISFAAKCILLLESMFLMILFLFAGKHITIFFSSEIANKIGVILLFIMGIWFCFQSVQKEKNVQKENADMLRNPHYCDKDHSNHIDAKEALSLGFILSIDSMGAGIAAGAAEISFLLSFFTAIFQILFLSMGIFLGKHFKKRSGIKENIWTAFSGCILISIALLRCFH